MLIRPVRLVSTAVLSLVPGGQIVRVTSKNRPGFHWAIDEGIEGYLMNQAELFKGGVGSPNQY
jgi:hypothetical protein